MRRFPGWFSLLRFSHFTYGELIMNIPRLVLSSVFAGMLLALVYKPKVAAITE